MNLSFCAFVIFVPKCHCKVTVSLGCHLNQSIAKYANGLRICQWYATSTTPVSLKPLGCQSITISTQGLAPRLFPSIEGNDRGAILWDECLISLIFNKVSLCHLSVTVSLGRHWQCKRSSKMIHWQRFRIVRVPPLEIFGEPLDQSEARILSSRPIGGLDFRKILGISQIFTVSLKCHWTTAVSLKPLGCQSITVSTQGLAPRLFPSIEGNDRGAAPRDECLIL